MSNRDKQKPTRSVVKALVCLLVNGACFATFAQTAPALAGDATPPLVEAVADQLAVEYGQQQMRRLAKNNDRDSLIAAVLIGLPNDAKSEPAQGHAELVQRLAREYSSDPLALYVAALICHVQLQPCPHPEYQSQLVSLAPANAIHFLLVPNAGKPSAAQLRQAALATNADTRFSALLGIVRSALTDQPVPCLPAQCQEQMFKENELALLLRGNEIAQVPWPRLGPTSAICNAKAAAGHENPQRHKDCSSLGLKLFSDNGNNIATRMVGSSMVRRFAKGTSAEAEAKALRRQYVWLNEQLPENATSAEKERLNQEEVQFGEWEAYQRGAERAGVSRIPPADWIPKNPDALLLPEEKPPSK